MSECPFCPYFDGVTKPHEVRKIIPLKPVVPGHVMFVPEEHVIDAADDPEVTARTMHAAAVYARKLPAANIITSKGADATQTVFHLHIHVVPRKPNDGLLLPWSNQHE
jgi:histidine triad (HIT) family protein